MADIKDRVMQAMRNLPPMPVAVQKLLAVMNDENSSAEHVTQVLSSDPALAGKVLKLVNSSYYGMSGEVSTITRAVVVLGFSGVRNVAMGFGMVSAMRKLGASGLGAFWDHALAAGAGAQAIAEQMPGRRDPEEAFIAGLMHDIGHVVLATAAPDQWRAAQDAALAGGDIIALEQEALGMSHATVGERLMRFWQLPDALQLAARWHHDIRTTAGREQPLTTLVALGDLLACIHGGRFERPLAEADLGRLLRLHCLEMSHVRAALGRMDHKIAEMQVFLKIADDAADHGDAVAAGPGAGAGAAPPAAVVLSADQERVAWVGGLLEHFGCALFPLKAYFNREAGHEAVGLVVLDPNSLTANQLDKMLPFLEHQGARLAVLAEGEPSPLVARLLARHAALPFVFSRQDLERALRGSRQPA